MAGYIVLGKYSLPLKLIKNQVENLEKTKAEMKEMGIKFVGFWLTMGQYDWVGICDAPDDQTMAVFSLKLGMGGNQTQTLRAFSEKELPGILSRLPEPKKE